MIAVAASLAVLGLVLALTRLDFHTGRGDLVASGERLRQLDERYAREFEELPERVVVVIGADDPDSARAFATARASDGRTIRTSTTSSTGSTPGP